MVSAKAGEYQVRIQCITSLIGKTYGNLININKDITGALSELLAAKVGCIITFTKFQLRWATEGFVISKPTWSLVF
jgi:hypothetical protein